MSGQPIIPGELWVFEQPGCERVVALMIKPSGKHGQWVGMCVFHERYDDLDSYDALGVIYDDWTLEDADQRIRSSWSKLQ